MGEYRLKIEAFTPETMPMKRLAEYLSDMAALLGEEASVHLVAIESGSTCPVVLVDWAADPKVRDRMARVRSHEGPEEAMRAARNIDDRLAKDNSSAAIVSGQDEKIFEFPGARRTKPLEWPSIYQSGEIVGVPIAVGGKQELVPVHLQDGETYHNLLASREMAKQLAAHLFTSTLRVTGHGRWRMAPGGGPWTVERFVIEAFEPVQAGDLEQALGSLRAVDADWKRDDDALTQLMAHRRTG